MEYPRGISARKAVQTTAEAAGAQSIDRAATLLLLVGRAGPQGARLTDLVAQTDLAKPTVHRMLTALVRAGLLDREPETGATISARRSTCSARSRARGSACTRSRAARPGAPEPGDRRHRLLSVARDVYAICLHREDGAYPIRVHALQAGDRHPLGVGAGSLALLAALPDPEVDEILAANADVLAAHYPRYAGGVLRALVAETRSRGYALNPGMLLADSWGIGVAIRGEGGRAVGALSIAAIEGRLREDRQREIARLLRREADWIEARLRQLGTGTRAGA